MNTYHGHHLKNDFSLNRPERRVAVVVYRFKNGIDLTLLLTACLAIDFHSSFNIYFVKYRAQVILKNSYI